ncbi:MAG: exopolysaccharide biosynthesis polyprenyl glycosylphosphotransferase [Cruoricaptor ignavus]|nr:exopolysaccharide biosynthesis polyprenyl glycosylphosphotransferase [Cruoricaptor ignavus]
MQRLRFSKYFKLVFTLLDLGVLAAIFYFFYLKNNSSRFDILEQEKNVIILFSLCIFWILLSGKTKLYSVQRNITYTNYLERVFTHLVFFVIGWLLLSRVLESGFIKNDRMWIATSITFIIFFLKSVIFFFLKYLRSIGINFRNVMFLCENKNSDVLRNIISERKDYGYKIFDFLESDFTIVQLREFWNENGIHTIFLPTENNLDKKLEQQIFEEAENHNIKITLIPRISQNNFFTYDLSYIESQPILTPAKFPLDFSGNFIAKRCFDILFSVAFLLFVGIWLFPLIALLIKIDSKGSVFFVQKRYGFHNEIFGCIKFRTMRNNDEANCRTTKKNDERITKIGKFLRKTSLDELPQFINILLGDMSLVGPRPHMLSVDNLYKPKIRRYTVRSLVKPGITGLAQVSGLRGDNGDMDIQMRKRILADSFYVKNWSFSLDLVIIFKTLILIIQGDKNAL